MIIRCNRPPLVIGSRMLKGRLIGFGKKGHSEIKGKLGLKVTIGHLVNALRKSFFNDGRSSR